MQKQMLTGESLLWNEMRQVSIGCTKMCQLQLIVLFLPECLLAGFIAVSAYVTAMSAERVRSPVENLVNSGEIFCNSCGFAIGMLIYFTI